MAKKNAQIKVLVALSGGVDSSVAAALLVKAGYNVTAAYMVNYDDRAYAEASADKSRVASHAIAQSAAACWVPDYRDAVRVAAHLNIPIIKLDFTKEYKEKVLDYMFAEYNAGRTPNPDVLCNKYIKFGVWLEKAKDLGFDFLATGHYARVKKLAISNKQLTNRLLVVNCSLLISKDTNKDQTYFLHQLNQEQLSRTMFPIGEYAKPQVRKLAKKFGLATAEKEESMGICFVGEVPMKEFLEQRIPPKKGNIVLSDGTVIGTHDGLAFYTIGQRHIGMAPPPYQGGVRGGLPSSLLPRSKGTVTHAQKTATPPNLPLERGGGDTRPLYVIGKKLETNELVVGYEDNPALFSKEITVSEVNWTSGQEPKFPLKCEVRLRHRQPLEKCVVTCHSERSEAQPRNPSTVTVTFAKPQRAVTPGQFAVFYKKGECLGGGVIT